MAAAALDHHGRAMTERRPDSGPPRSIFKAGDLGEVINALPALFGFPPENSLVSLGLHGPRIVFGMRLDLADVGDDVDRTAGLAVRHLEQQGVGGAITLAIGEPLDLGRRLVLAVEARLVRVRPLAGGWATDRRYWVSMAGGSPRGYAYRRSLDHPAAAQAVWEGREVASSRAAVEATMAPLGTDRLAEVTAVAGDVVADLAPGPDVTTKREAAVYVANDVVPVLDDLRAGRAVTDHRLLRMACLVTHTRIRDAAWMMIAPDNARDYVRVWLHVARHVPHEWAPPAYSLAAFACWMCGDGAKSVMAAQQALRLDPAYSMAGLMLDLATSGLSPDRWPEGTAQLRGMRQVRASRTTSGRAWHTKWRG